jgi:hypothetical protein
MPQALNLELRAKAELLTYLVASQLLAKSVTGDWLTIENVVVFERIWLAAHGGGADWLERVSISSWSRTLAQRVDVKFPVMLGAESVETMFSENPRLDFRAPFVRAVYHMCLNHLVETGWFKDWALRSGDGEAS